MIPDRYRREGEIPDQEVYTVTEAAAFLRISRTSLWKLRQQRLISYVAGPRITFRREHLNEYLDRHEVAVDARVASAERSQ